MSADLEGSLAEINGLLLLDPDNVELKALAEDLQAILLQQSTPHPQQEENVIDLTKVSPPIDLTQDTPITPITLDVKEGGKCCIPVQHDSATYFLPAMILQLVADKRQARVLILTPITKESRTCDWFLDGRCESELCGRSHGETIALEHILPVEVLSIKMKEGSKVLARYSGDGVYYRASIVAMEDSDGPFWVTFDGYGDDKVQVGADSIIPLTGLGLDAEAGAGAGELDTDDEGDSLSNSFSDCNNDGSETKGGDTSDEIRINFHYGDGQAMGTWEAHTKGIGGKLLAKMGYKLGEGLGKSGEGRIRPVEAKILPTGKGLGANGTGENNRKRGRTHGIAAEHRRQKKKRRQDDIQAPADMEKPDIFDFLNTSLNKSKPKPRRKSAIKTSTSKEGNHHLTLLDLQKEYDYLSAEIARASKAVQRNRKDQRIAAGYQERIKEFEVRLQSVKREEARIRDVMQGEKTKKSMVKF